MNHLSIEYHNNGSVSIKNAGKVIDFRTVEDYKLWREFEDNKFLMGRKKYTKTKKNK